MKLKTTALGAFALLLASQAAHAAGEAKNVIFFLGDGMGVPTITASRIYKYGESGKLHMESLKRSVRIKTYALDAQTTDSAPSMSAYMTGVKMKNEVISMSPDTVADTKNCTSSNGQPVETILELAKASGKAVGAVTTTEITHATPAATFSHICHRNLYEEIAAQVTPGSASYNAALKDGVNVLFGGGRNFFDSRADSVNLLTLFDEAGYSYVSNVSQLNALPNTKSHVLGLFTASSHMSYELDRNPALQPSIAQMTSKAIRLLSQSKEGYFLMVEGGRIDHALHGTNAKRVLEDTVAFDDAIKAALDLVDLKETLVVVTADHDHVMVINGYPAVGNSILDLVKDADGVPSLDAEGFTYTTLAFGNGPNRPNTRSSIDSAVALGDNYLQLAGIRLGSETHGGSDILLLADGPGAENFRGTMDNTAVFNVLRNALGL